MIIAKAVSESKYMTTAGTGRWGIQISGGSAKGCWIGIHGKLTMNLGNILIFKTAHEATQYAHAVEGLPMSTYDVIEIAERRQKTRR